MVRAIPTVVIAKLLGIPEADHRDFIEWSERMVAIAEGAMDPSPHGQELVRYGMAATVELNEYLRTNYQARREALDDDLISRLVSSSVSDRMSERDIVAAFTQLVFAGNETTPKLMGTALFALAQFPDQRELLRNDRSLIPQGLEEIHRWMSPAQVNWRIVQPGRSGSEIAGVEVPEGSTLLCLQGIANRDPSRWDDPDRLDIQRKQQPHLGFGFGMHSCLGLNLARLETQVWLSRLLDEIPDWRVVDVDWGPSWVARGPVRIDITG
jgi:cytochrome P450